MKKYRMTFGNMEIAFREASRLALIHARMAMRTHKRSMKIAHALTFLEKCLTVGSYEAVVERVFDHDDPFDIDELVELIGIVADPSTIGSTPSTKG